jgi:hypothetical protein
MDNVLKLQITAYHRWLIQIAGGNTFKLAYEIANQAIYDKNPQAQKLMELTGEPYTIDTFHKAAQLLLTAIEIDAEDAGIGFDNEAEIDEYGGIEPGDYNDYKDKIEGY